MQGMLQHLFLASVLQQPQSLVGMALHCRGKSKAVRSLTLGMEVSPVQPDTETSGTDDPTLFASRF